MLQKNRAWEITDVLLLKIYLSSIHLPVAFAIYMPLNNGYFHFMMI